MRQIQFLNTDDLKEYVDVKDLPAEYGDTTDWAFEYTPKEERGSDYVYERGWPEEDIAKALELEQEIQDRAATSSKAADGDESKTAGGGDDGGEETKEASGNDEMDTSAATESGEK